MPGSLTDWELWACAAHVEKHHGDRAPHHVAEQLGRLALAGDWAGVAAWQAIAWRLDRLAAGPSASRAGS